MSFRVYSTVISLATLAALSASSVLAAPAAPQSTPTGTKSYLDYVKAGHADMEKSQPRAAMAQYTEAVKLKPNDPYARKCLAYSMVSGGYPGQGAQQMEIVLKMTGSPTIEDLSYTADAYARAKLYSKSVQLFNKALTADPTNPTVMIRLAEVQKLSGMTKEAHQNAKRAMPLALEPELKRRALSVLSEDSSSATSTNSTPSQSTQSTQQEDKPLHEM